jgi:DNA polymerase-3 subunit gamma/tau
VALAQNGAQPAPDDPDAARIASLAGRLDAGRVQVMYQVAILGRRDLPLAPDEVAGFGMAVMRMLSFGAASSGEPLPARSTPAGAPARGDSGPRAPAAVASEPAPAVVPAAAFEGDWASFVERQSLSGMAGLLARYGELESFEGNHLKLVVPEAQRMVAEKPYQEKLKAELAPRFGAGFRLSVRVGETNGKSVAAVRGVEAQKKLDGATAAIAADPFVRDLVEGMGAQVVASSIRPANEKDSETNDDRRGKP